MQQYRQDSVATSVASSIDGALYHCKCEWLFEAIYHKSIESSL